MDTYFYLVLFFDFIHENIHTISSAFVFIFGLQIGWLLGHIRNNKIHCAMINSVTAMQEQLKSAKDHEDFANHEISILNRELDRRQHIINAYKIGGEQLRQDLQSDVGAFLKTKT